MNTIVRNNGHVHVLSTVVKTIKYLVNNKAGFYTIAEILEVINRQVEPHEYLTRKMVVAAIVKIAEIQKQKR